MDYPDPGMIAAFVNSCVSRVTTTTISSSVASRSIRAGPSVSRTLIPPGRLAPATSAEPSSGGWSSTVRGPACASRLVISGMGLLLVLRDVQLGDFDGRYHARATCQGVGNADLLDEHVAKPVLECDEEVDLADPRILPDQRGIEARELDDEGCQHRDGLRGQPKR